MIPSIFEVRGIGPATAKTLAERGIHSVTDLATTHIKQLTAVPGFSDIRAAQVIDDATQLLADMNESVDQAVDEVATKQKPALKAKQKKSKTEHKKTIKNKDKGQKVKAVKAKKTGKKDKKAKKAKKQSERKPDKRKKNKAENKRKSKRTDKVKKTSKKSP